MNFGRYETVKEMQKDLSFEEKYAEFLTELKSLSCQSKEEKRSFFRAHPMHDSICMFFLEQYETKYDKLKRKLGNSNSSYKPDLDIASYENRSEIDGLVFMEAVENVICNYRGEGQEKDCGFVVRVKKVYKQIAGEASAQKYLEDRNISDSSDPVNPKHRPISQRRLVYVLRAVKAIKELREKECFMHCEEDKLIKITEDLMKKSEFSFSKREKELINALLSEKVPLSINETISEDSDIELDEVIEDEQDTYGEVLDKRANLCTNIEEKWELVMAAKGMKDQHTFKLFFTRDVLKVLKTDGNGSKYIREPAGDEKVYQYMVQQGDFLYGRIFYLKYLHRAFLQMPGDFYETYVRILKSDFDFSDKILAEVEGKDKSVISRRRDRYKSWMCVFRKYYEE